MLKPSLRLPFAALSTTLLLATALAITANAQSSENAPSVAEAARRAREKKTGKPARTLTDDNLQKASPSDISVVGTPQATPAPAADAANAATAPKVPIASAEDEQAKQRKASFAAAVENAKRQLATAEHELDVLQRQQALDDDAYHSKADFASDTAGKAKLDHDADLVGSKKILIQTLKEKIEELQAQVGSDAASAPATSEPKKDTPPN